MTPRDYRESWAWVHYFLNGPPAGKASPPRRIWPTSGRRRRRAPVPPVEDEDADPTARLIAQWTAPRDGPGRGGRPRREGPRATVRFQDPPAEPRRGRRGRWRGWRGLAGVLTRDQWPAGRCHRRGGDLVGAGSLAWGIDLGAKPEDDPAGGVLRT